MSTWTTHDDPPPEKKPDIEDVLKLTDNSTIRIVYSPYSMVYMTIDPPHRKPDVADRDGERRRVLRELLPLAEEALEALRQAVAESEPEPADDWSESETCETQQPVDMLDHANSLMKGPNAVNPYDNFSTGYADIGRNPYEGAYRLTDDRGRGEADDPDCINENGETQQPDAEPSNDLLGGERDA